MFLLQKRKKKQKEKEKRKNTKTKKKFAIPLVYFNRWGPPSARVTPPDKGGPEG